MTEIKNHVTNHMHGDPSFRRDNYFFLTEKIQKQWQKEIKDRAVIPVVTDPETPENLPLLIQEEAIAEMQAVVATEAKAVAATRAVVAIAANAVELLATVKEWTVAIRTAKAARQA